MAREARVLRASVFLLVANVSAGVLNYLFQVRAAAQLDAPAYGALNGWMAYLSVALFLGVAAQIASNFFVLTEVQLRRAGWLTIAATLGSLAMLASTRARTGEPSAFELGVACTVLGTLQLWMLGQFQSRTWFVWMGSAVVLTAAVKWLGMWLPMISPIDLDHAYFWAFPLSYAAACLFQSAALLGLTWRMSSARSALPATNRRAWMAALLLALAMSLLPQLDMLNLRGLQSDHELGLYARTALFSKAIFFAAVTLLQVALPYHVRAHRGEPQADAYVHIRRLERLGVTACVVGSFVFAALAPWVTVRYLGFELLAEHRLWVLTSCLALTALYGHLQAIQVHCATGEWQRAAARLAAVIALYPLAQAFGRNVSVGAYLVAAVAYYIAIEGIWRLHAAMSRPAQVRPAD